MMKTNVERKNIFIFDKTYCKATSTCEVYSKMSLMKLMKYSEVELPLLFESGSADLTNSFTVMAYMVIYLYTVIVYIFLKHTTVTIAIFYRKKERCTASTLKTYRGTKVSS